MDHAHSENLSARTPDNPFSSVNVREQHDWANVVGQSKRKRFGEHRIRICRHCGAHELTDQATLKRAWRVGSLIVDEPIQCDPYHREVAKEIGLKYLPYKCREQWTEEDFKRAELAKDPPALDAETVKREVEATEGGVE